jgi:NADPH-dependent 2,4-dienoyl-CoA reductase/sulfur reductase-like enzyme
LRRLSLTRRRFAASLAATWLGGVAARAAAATARARLVVVGGGFGGATAARFAKRLLPDLTVVLIEPNERYIACPLSNLVVTGHRNLEQQTFSYAALAQEGIDVRRTSATDIDAVGRTVTLDGGDTLQYDRLILAPGIEFRWGALEGYGPESIERMPHAWKAGPQTLLLERQLESMPDGGVVVMSVTAAPFRCPPGPYERASLIAHYLAAHKPRAKLIVLDSNDRFSKQPLFTKIWAERYASVLEWRGASNDGRVVRVNPETMTLDTDFESVHGDVVNVVPPQQAGLIAQRAGATDSSGWCPVDAVSFESRLQRGIHVIGDATIAAPMPKSAFAANAHAKVCAIQVARLLSGLEAEPTTLLNNCYSYVDDTQAISIAGVYHTSGGTFTEVPGSGGISPLDAPLSFRQQEAHQAADWFRAITRETFLS